MRACSARAQLAVSEMLLLMAAAAASLAAPFRYMLAFLSTPFLPRLLTPVRGYLWESHTPFLSALLVRSQEPLNDAISFGA